MASSSAWALADCTLSPGPIERVRSAQLYERAQSVIDGDTLVLESGWQVRLVGIQAPKLGLGRPNFPDWPLADVSRARLDDLTRDAPLNLYFGTRAEDRHGRWLAHLVDGQGRWLQAVLIEEGLARVYSFSDNRICVEPLLELEQQARREGRGIWGLAYYAVMQAENEAALLDAVETFQLVEGRVREVSEVGRRIYLNFGGDWRKDFTLTIESGDRSRFADDLSGLEGRQVRVRGWLRDFNGPAIRLTHPEQLEVLPLDPLQISAPD